MSKRHSLSYSEMQVLLTYKDNCTVSSFFPYSPSFSAKAIVPKRQSATPTSICFLHEVTIILFLLST